MSHHNTKIIATVGPSCNNINQLKQMCEAGMDIIRINASHTKEADLKQTFGKIKELRKEFPYVGLALDTKGPELRIGNLKTDLKVEQGDTLIFTNSHELAIQNPEYIFVDYSGLTSLTEENQILIDDGLLKLSVEKVEDKLIETKALNKHILHPGKSMNIPGHDLKLPFLSTKDINDIKLGISYEIDFIFLSFVSSKKDLEAVRKLLKDMKNPPLLVSKIESQLGIENIREIVEHSDGIMVARGDLGAEVGYEKVFPLQKYIVAECVRVGKPCICATQMLESICHSTVPTRAEVTDVGCAILDGCDAVMLSSETASGDYPVIAVDVLSRICNGAENVQREYSSFSGFRMGAALKVLAGDCQVKKIVVLADTFEQVLSVSSVRQPVPLLVISSDIFFLRKMSLLRDCIPIWYEHPKMIEGILRRVRGELKDGEAVVVYDASSLCINKYYYN